jgi:hypothetical protein
MPRLCSAPMAGAVLAMLLVPHVAAAGPVGPGYPADGGPIEWSWHSDVVYDRDYGQNFAVTLAPGQTVRTADGDLNGYWLFSSTGSSRPEPGSYKAEYSFAVRVTITDHASGESGTLSFPGWYSSMWSYPASERDNPDRWRWDWEVSDFGDTWNSQGFVLGRTAYTVRAFGGGQGQFPNGEMVVRTDSLPVATPEPGTLALAGFGLLPLAGTVARRRSLAR